MNWYSQLGLRTPDVETGVLRVLPLIVQRRCLSLVRVVAIGLATAAGLVPPASAGTIPYPLSAFTLVNSNADGSLASSDGITATITGGNNGSGLDGTTDLLTVALANVTITFHWVYASNDAPGNDFAGYLIGGSFTMVADTSGMQGDTTFTALAGQPFGFGVNTSDNGGEPGVFTVATFGAPTSVPEPGNGVLIAVLAVIVFTAGRNSLCRGGGIQK